MPSFYVPKKNRCPGCLSIGYGKLNFATSSSVNTNNVGANTVYQVSKSQDTPSVEEKKGKGNTQKRGSGGNSYAAYLAKKRGQINTNCC